MDPALIVILACWLVLNLVAIPLLGRRVTRRIAAMTGGATHTDGYASILLSRLAVQACRVLGVERACVLVRDHDHPDWLIAAAGHGLGEEAIGQRVRVRGQLRSALDGRATQFGGGERLLPALGTGSAVATGSRDVVLCAATADFTRRFAQPEIALLADLAELCTAAIDDLRVRQRLDATISRRASELAKTGLEASAPDSPIDTAELAKRIGSRLGLERGALVELEIAGRVGLSQAPNEIARLPGFEAVALILRFAAERWDGRGAHGLPADRIPLASRILAPCHSLRLLTAASPAGAGDTVDVALRHVMGASGTIFDPTVVAALSRELLGDVPEFAAVTGETDWASADAQYAAVL